jgi:hypothetical protein
MTQDSLNGPRELACRNPGRQPRYQRVCEAWRPNTLYSFIPVIADRGMNTARLRTQEAAYGEVMWIADVDPI